MIKYTVHILIERSVCQVPNDFRKHNKAQITINVRILSVKSATNDLASDSIEQIDIHPHIFGNANWMSWAGNGLINLIKDLGSPGGHGRLIESNKRLKACMMSHHFPKRHVSLVTICKPG